MKLDSSFEGKIIDLEHLDHILNNLGFHRGEQSDYERVTYDRKFEILDAKEVYYLRIQGVAVEGNIDSGHADVKIIGALLGKHYYPHGVEYGEGENFPNSIVNKSNELIKRANEEIASMAKA